MVHKRTSLCSGPRGPVRKDIRVLEPHLQKAIDRYLEREDLYPGFAQVKCRDCHHEYLLAFSCKHRHFCTSCHQKRVVEFEEWLSLVYIGNR